MKKYFIKTFGCAMNTADAEKIAFWFKKKGWQLATTPKDADEFIIVTCSVRQAAEDRVYGLVNNLSKLKINNSKLKIVVTGCMMRYPLKWLKDKMPQVDEFRKINEFKTTFSPEIHPQDAKALVSIMEGCNNFCSYCVVPFARGREISRPMGEIICEVQELVKRGSKEIMLLGQNVNSYNGKSKIKNQKSKPKSKAQKYLTPFAQLLFVLNGIPGVEKISFLTSNPWDLNDEIIEAMSLPKVDRYFHLPVQSGDNEILRKMNRHYNADDYLQLVEKIRQKIPEIKIGTDIIVGFPGETEEQFQNTIDLCKRIGFVKAYVSMYSPREQTAAYKLVDNISHKEKRRRWKILEELINSDIIKV